MFARRRLRRELRDFIVGHGHAGHAKTFLDTVNDTTLRLGIQQAQAGWVQQTYITDDTEAIAARANQAANEPTRW